MADPSLAETVYPARYDVVVKDLFQRDRPSILDTYIGARQIRGFLNLEFAIVERRIADLLTRPFPARTAVFGELRQPRTPGSATLSHHRLEER